MGCFKVFHVYGSDISHHGKWQLLCDKPFYLGWESLENIKAIPMMSSPPHVSSEWNQIM